MDSSFPQVRKLLAVVMDGKQMVGQQLWADAKRELDVADPLLLSFRPDHLPSVSQTDAPTPSNAMEALAGLFIVLEHVIAQSKAAGALNKMDPLDCDRMLRAKSVLQRYGYETNGNAVRTPMFKLARRREGHGPA